MKSQVNFPSQLKEPRHSELGNLLKFIQQGEKSSLSHGWKDCWHRKGFLHRSQAASVSVVPGWANIPACTAAHSYMWMCLSRAHSSSFYDLPTHGCIPVTWPARSLDRNDLTGAHSEVPASIPAWPCWLLVWSFIKSWNVAHPISPSAQAYPEGGQLFLPFMWPTVASEDIFLMLSPFALDVFPSFRTHRKCQ